ncbi:MAG: bacterioferritin-associated ferredoxin [Draconibacterium sp.]
MARRLVCICNLVDEDEIKSVLKKGAETTAHIQEFTRAGTTCGRCLPEIDALVEEYQKKKPKDQQGKLELGL